MKYKYIYIYMNKKELIIKSKYLSVINKKKLLLHSKHHTLKHIKIMIKEMKKGATFKKSHLIAINFDNKK